MYPFAPGPNASALPPAHRTIARTGKIPLLRNIGRSLTEEGPEDLGDPLVGRVSPLLVEDHAVRVHDDEGRGVVEPEDPGEGELRVDQVFDAEPVRLLVGSDRLRTAQVDRHDPDFDLARVLRGELVDLL